MLPSQPVLEPGTDVSRYRVEALVAQGGMGLVYRARDLRLDRPVALKVLSPALSGDDRFRERFVRESRLAAAVDHPNVIPVYEADDWHGLLYLAMRFVDGVDLHTVLATSGPMDPVTALPLLDQAADALDAAHRVGLVHRDVKPGNFMLAGAAPDRVPHGTHVYLTDFGLTKSATSVSGLTKTGQLLGSLHYVAPEQIRGDGVDARTDVYALACVAFAMFAGRPPYDLEGDAGLLWAHMTADPPALSRMRGDLPPVVDDVLARGLAKEASERPGSCGEFVAELRAALPDVPAARRTGSTTPTRTGKTTGGRPHHAAPGAADPAPPAAPARRRSRTWAAAAVAVVALVVAGLLVWSPWSGPDLASRAFGVVPYRADVPADWRSFPSPDDDLPSVVFGPEDFQGVQVDDPSSLAAGAELAADEPERLVSLYVDAAVGLDEEPPEDLAGQVVSALPEGSTLEPTGTMQVGDDEAVVLGGSLRLSDDQELQLYGAVVREQVLVMCAAPTAVFDEWQETFEQIIASVERTS